MRQAGGGSSLGGGKGCRSLLGLHLFDIIVVVAGEDFDMVGKDFNDLVGYSAEQIPVMGDEKHRSGEFCQRVFQYFLAAQVKVVGRFVQHQEVSTLGHQHRKSQLGPFAARKDADLL